MDIGYDYEKCIGLKVKPRKGDGLLFYSLMINGTIDRVRAGLSKWPCSCVSRSLSCTRSRTHVRSFILEYILPLSTNISILAMHLDFYICERR